MPPKKFLYIAMAVRLAVWAGIALLLLFGDQIIRENLLPCFWVQNFGKECATCGATRAVVSVLHGNFSAAAAYNPVVAFAVLPIFGFLLLSDLAVLLFRLVTRRRCLSLFEYIFVVFAGPLAPLTPCKGEASR
ncbi:MAG: DUF2752 domain-containing protein [Oscillospiraceae bacterium]|jgi:hypothetical protein